MAKQLCIKYNDKEYTLEYTRKSIELMERRGFKISDIQDKPVPLFLRCSRERFSHTTNL